MWERFERGNFHSDIDSWVFSKGLETEEPRNVGSVLDLGCGSARPVIRLLNHNQYVGVDIDAEVVRIARANLIKAGCDKPDTWRSELTAPQEGWDLVGANLPYLPTPKTGVLGREVDGGRKGIELIPNSVLDIAESANAKRVVLNMSSLCDIDEIGRIISGRGYGVVRVVATVADLEDYAKKVLDYLLGNSMGHPGGFARMYERTGQWRQMILSVELVRGEGAPFGLIRETEEILRPDTDRFERMIIGT